MIIGLFGFTYKYKSVFNWEGGEILSIQRIAIACSSKEEQDDYWNVGRWSQVSRYSEGWNILYWVGNRQFRRSDKRGSNILRLDSTIMLGPDFITIVLLFIIFCLFTKVFYNQKENKYKNFPLGPKCLPVIGNLHIFDITDPSRTLTQLSNKYGPVFSIQLGMQKVIVLYGYDAVKDAFVNHAEEFADRADIPIFTDIFKGHGIIFSNGENWKVMRRFTISTLRDFGMGRKSLEDRINEESDCLVQTFKSYGGKPFENTTIINSAVGNIIASILFGHRYNHGDPTILKFMSLVNEDFKLMGSPMIMLYNIYPNLIRWLPGGHRTLFKNNSEFQDFIIKTFIRQKNRLDVRHQGSLIDAFLTKQLENNPESDQYFHNDNLIALVSNLFIAGMETTSTTMRWAILLMMKYPEIQKNVQKEIDQVIGLRQPQMEHRKHMPYTDAVIHEIQRFGNIIPATVPHAATQDVMFRGYFIPKGTQSNKNYFEKPDEFYPEHFLNSQGHFVKNEAFLPFLAGKRRCAGEILAKAELFIFFTKLLQNFTFQAPPGIEVDITPVVGFTNAPMMHDMCAVPRHSD
ncbi:cytochrome P450 2K6-like [Dendropsophus ebraccatus]|uniref:cytochrome P450 2K6-like n=1 Tax=Dendropsophus ebraccatus TaxID=150705 RepID=UPI003831AECB